LNFTTDALAVKAEYYLIHSMEFVNSFAVGVKRPRVDSDVQSEGGKRF
jgi:hypothetical protein